MSLGARIAGLLALLATSLGSAAGSLWVRGSDQLFEIDNAANRLVRSLVVDGGEALAADDGGAWIVAKGKLLRHEVAGSPAWSLDLAPLLKQPAFLALDPRGHHLWVVGKEAFLRLALPDRSAATFAFDGNKVRAVGAGLDGSLWVLGNKELWHYSAQGALLARVDLNPLVTPEPKLLAVDSLGGRIWLAGEKSLIRFDPANPSSTLVSVTLSDKADALAIDNRSGSVWVAGNDRLHVLRPDGAITRSVDLKAAGIKDVVALSFDSVTGSLWAIHNGSATRLDSTGALLATVPLAKNPEALAISPLRLEPTVAIVSPPDGLLTSQASLPFVVRYGADCSGTPCGFAPEAYSGYQLSATLNGAPPATPFSYDPLTGEARSVPAVRLPEGTNTLEVRVTDGFGTESEPARSHFTIDTIAPQFVALSPADGSSVMTPSLSISGSVSEMATITLAGDGASASTQGTDFTFPVTLKTGLNAYVLEATDAVGNRGSATLRITLANAMKVLIETPLSGATLSGTDVLVTGTVDAPPNTGVVVNGVTAHREANRFFVPVPLQAGALAIEAVATSPGGATASARSEVTVTALPDFEVVPTFRVAFAPTGMAFSFINRTSRTITRVDADFNGDGRTDNTSASPTPTFSTAYFTPGTFTPRFVLRDSSGRTYTLTTQLVIRDNSVLDQELKSLWSAFVAQLSARNVSGALAFFTTSARGRYADPLEVLRDSLPAIAASFSAPLTFSIDSDIGEYLVNRLIDGRDRVFFVYFLRDNDGVWRLDSM